MTALWSRAELSAALGAAPSAPLSAAVGGVSIDSRTLQAGDLFFAIKGDAHDGHDHVARAFEAGAAAAVVSRERARRARGVRPGVRGRRHAGARWSGWASRRARARRRGSSR